MKVSVITMVTDSHGPIPKRLDKGGKRVGNQRARKDPQNYSVPEIGQNTEKSPRDLSWLAVTQTPVKDHQLTLVWKIH